MEHALRLNLSGSAFGAPTHATPKFLEPLAPPTFPFTSPAWSRAHKPRDIALLDVFKDHELLATYTVDQKPIYLIGRNAVACDIVLNHCSISRLHATIIHHKDGATYLVDLGSCHGTFVDDIRLRALQPTLIVHGSTLKFGASSRSYAFKSFESHEQILERVQSRIELEPDEMEVEQNTLLNRALSYRLGFSIPATHKAADAEGDDPMAALYPARQIEASTSAAALIRRTQSEDSSISGAFSLGPLPTNLPVTAASVKALNDAGRKRSRAQSAGLPATSTAAQPNAPPGNVQGDGEDDDAFCKRVHFCERPAETIPDRSVYFSPEHGPSRSSSATSSPQIVPESNLPPLTITKKSESEPTRRSLSPSPPLLLVSIGCDSGNNASQPTTPASHEVAS